jgi:hypothetical protein
MKFVMKKYIFLLSLATCISCTDALDIAPSGNLTLEQIYQDPNQVEALLATCYSQLPTKGCWGWLYTNSYVACSDDGWDSSEQWGGQMIRDVYYDLHTTPPTYHGLFTFYAQGGVGNLSPNEGVWPLYFTQIRLCNQFIEDADKMAFNPTNPKEKLVAEARVLRAFYYMELVKIYGAVPIFENTLALDADYTVLKRNPVSEVVDFIAADCDAALQSGTLSWRQTSEDEAIRATNALCWALKITARLFAASPLHNPANDASRWTVAYQAAKEGVTALKANGYRLMRNDEANANLFSESDADANAAIYRQLACQDYTTTSGLSWDKETLFQHTIVPIGNGGCYGWNYNYVGVLDGAEQAGTCPTQELVDAYETIDGQPVLDLATPYADERHLIPNYNPANTLYNLNDPYANRDPRFYATVLKNGDQVIWNNGEVVTVDAYKGGQFEIMTEGTYMVLARYTRTGYYVKKFVTPGASSTNRIPSSPAKIYKLSEMLLNLAEAANEAGQTADALAAVNEVRRRVSMPDITETDQTKLRLRIRNERRVELALEENRYFDLRRWSKPTDDLGKYQKYLTAMYITKNDDDSFSYERKNIWEDPRGGWANRELFAPIHIDEASRMQIITGENWQNPGW